MARSIPAVGEKDSSFVVCCSHLLLLLLQQWYQPRSERRIQHDRYLRAHAGYLSYSVVLPILSRMPCTK